MPHVVVEEVQSLPSYGHDGRTRRDCGGQLVYTMSGEGRLRIKDKIHALTPGKAFLHNHRDCNIGYFFPPEGKETWRFLWISFVCKSVEKMVDDIVGRYGYIYDLPWDRGVVRKMYSYRNHRGAVQVLTPLSGAKLVMDILTGIGDGLEDQLIRSPQSMLVARAQEYILENINRELSVNDIADALLVSREHLTRVFQAQTGMTPKAYILSRKMNLACDLLMSSQLSCKEIAERVGFSDPTSFSRAFRRLTEMAPGELRENGYRPDI